MSRNYRYTGKYQLTSHIATILLVLILFISISYFFFFARPDERAQQLALQKELGVNQELWENRRPGSYRYVVERDCNCPDEDKRAYTATEQAGQRRAKFPIPVESVTGILLTAPPRPVWIDDIFDVLARALGNGSNVDVRYDNALGYPKTVVISPDERYEIRDFEVFGSR